MLSSCLSRAVALATAAAVLVGAFAAPAVAKPFVIASLSDDPIREMRRYRGFHAFLEENLAGSSFTSAEVIVIPRSDLMVEAFRRERAHVYIDSPLVAMRVAEATGAQPLLRRWRRGVKEFWSEFLVRADSGIETLDQLQGRTLGFEDPESTSGHYLPRSEILATGTAVVTMFSLNDPLERDAVNSIFYGDAEIGVQWLLDGAIDALTIGNDDAEEIIDESDGAIVSIGRTMAVPRHIVIHHPNMADGDVAWLTELLLGMDDTEDGRAVLEGWSDTVRFDAFPGGLEATFGPIAERLRLLNQGGNF